MPSRVTATGARRRWMVMPPVNRRRRRRSTGSGRDTGVARALPRAAAGAPSVELAWQTRGPPLRGHPARFLGSSWPWRSLAYLLTTVAVGLATLLVCVGCLGVLTLVIVVGRSCSGCRCAASVGVLERPQAPAGPHGAPARASCRERLRAGRRLPVSWPEVGYAFLLAVVLWPLDFLVVVFAVAVPVRDAARPRAVDGPTHEHGRLARRPRRRGLARRARRGGRAGGRGVRRHPGRGGPGRPGPDAAGPARGAAGRGGGRPASLAGRTGRRLRDRAAPDRARPARRRPAAAGRPHHDAGAGGARRTRRPGAGHCAGRPPQAEEALAELRGTVRGIHPRVLVDHGLAAAVHELADRSPVPTTVDIRLPDGCRPRSSRRRTSSSARR